MADPAEGSAAGASPGRPTLVTACVSSLRHPAGRRVAGVLHLREHERRVRLIIGVLFVTISAAVNPGSLHHLVLATLGLVAVLVVVTRPLVAFFATIGTELSGRERAFIGWMAPRGIVAAATASTFGAALAAHHVGGAAKILPAGATAPRIAGEGY